MLYDLGIRFSLKSTCFKTTFFKRFNVFKCLQENACQHVKDTDKLFASPQCIRPGSNKKLTHDMCLPPLKEILKRTKKIVKKVKARSVFVATDSKPLISELTKALAKLKVRPSLYASITFVRF